VGALDRARATALNRQEYPGSEVVKSEH